MVERVILTIKCLLSCLSFVPYRREESSPIVARVSSRGPGGHGVRRARSLGHLFAAVPARN
jgi:hypothetical protein